jgi:hypothetical protein
MNQRRRLEREIIRDRRRAHRPVTLTRITTPNGVRARVIQWAGAGGGWGNGYVDYQAPGALVHAPFPPTTDVIRELGLWAG